MWFCSQQEIVIRQIGEVWNDTIGEKPSYGRKWRAGDQCAPASMRVNIHFSDADSGTAGIVDEMSVQKAGSPDHRDHGEGSTTDTAEPAGDTVPEGGLSNLDSIFPAVVAVPAEVVDRLDELLADTTDEPATDSKQAEPQPTTGKVEQVIWDEQPTSSLSEAGISGADTNDKVKPEPDANPEGSNSKKVKQKKSKAKTK